MSVTATLGVKEADKSFADVAYGRCPMRRIFRRIKTELRRGGEEGRETEIARNVVPLLSIGGRGGESKSLFNLMSRIIADSAVSPPRALVAPISFPAVKKYCGVSY